MTAQPEITERDLPAQAPAVRFAYGVRRNVPRRSTCRSRVFPGEVRGNDEQSAYDAAVERARRTDVLQRADHEFDPIQFDTEAARVYGRVTAAVIAAGRKPRRRALDLMIASIAIAKELPLYTTNPDDFVGLEQLMTVVPCGGR
jgi:predicted nucleic acid-binding protein